MSTKAFSGLDVRVARKDTAALDICIFELVDVDGKTLPPFSAGSHIDVQLPNGLVRQYSLCNAPSEGHRYLIGVLKDPASRGGSKAMHDLVREGSLLRISTPKNHFPLAHESPGNLLIAGGIGVTPILCMAERLANVGAAFEMHYCTRSRDRTAFVDRIASSPYASRVQYHFDDGEPGQKLDIAALAARHHEGADLYVCGPRGFMETVLGAARGAGWPESRLHHEFFSANVSHSHGDCSFEVELANSKRIVVVPKNATVVEALAAAGVVLPTSCEQGVCGTCLTRVLAGEPEHRDSYLTPAEQAANDRFLPCCSRAKSARLLLDL